MKATARVMGYACILLVFLLSSAVVGYDVIFSWRARSLIRVLKTIEVGKTTGREAVGIAERFGGSAFGFIHTVTKTSDETSWRDVPVSTCVTGDCYLAIYAVERLDSFRSLFVFLSRYPSFLRRVPMSGFGADMEIKRGVVRELRASMGSMDAETQYMARTDVYGVESVAAPWNRTPWSVRNVHAHITGGPPGRSIEIRVEAWSSAPHDRILRAFDFNTHCLWLGMRCSPCQILPSACDALTHGDWYEFEMPEAALAQFRSAVNGLALGVERDAVYDRLGGYESLVERKLRDLNRDKLPFDFPDGAILGSPNTCNLDFYVKKWRLYSGSPRGPGDRYVTFVMEDDCRRLKRIESRVDGISSRP